MTKGLLIPSPNLFSWASYPMFFNRTETPIYVCQHQGLMIGVGVREPLHQRLTSIGPQQGREQKQKTEKHLFFLLATFSSKSSKGFQSFSLAVQPFHIALVKSVPWQEPGVQHICTIVHFDYSRTWNLWLACLPPRSCEGTPETIHLTTRLANLLISLHLPLPPDSAEEDHQVWSHWRCLLSVWVSGHHWAVVGGGSSKSPTPSPTRSTPHPASESLPPHPLLLLTSPSNIIATSFSFLLLPIIIIFVVNSHRYHHRKPSSNHLVWHSTPSSFYPFLLQKATFQ